VVARSCFAHLPLLLYTSVAINEDGTTGLKNKLKNVIATNQLTGRIAELDVKLINFYIEFNPSEVKWLQKVKHNLSN
jgi:hypothetical protein